MQFHNVVFELFLYAKIIDENQNLRSEQESKMSELNARSKELDDLAAKSSHDKSNLEQEKQKVCDFLGSASHLFCTIFKSFEVDSSCPSNPDMQC